MMCETCFSGPKAQQEALTSIQAEAKQYAVAHETNVFIYRNEDGWAYMSEAKARELNIQPTGGVVSYLRPLPTG